MQKIISLMLLVIGASTVALAQQPSPEIDSTSVVSGLALVGGVLLVMRGRRKK